MFMELYYKNYGEAYGEKDKILPYSVLIYELDKRVQLEKILLDNGFECVVQENGYPCMYVNLTLKRFGRSVKACKSATINPEPLSFVEFFENILMPYIEQAQNRRTGITMQYMSYLEAHKIVNKNIDIVEQHDKNLPFYRESAFDYTKEELQIAYKIFMAVAYRYGSAAYSSKELELYTSLIKNTLCMPWVGDDFADEYMKCENILSNGSWLGKIKYRAAIPYVKDKKAQLTKELFDKNFENNPVAIEKEINVFINTLSKLIDESVRYEKMLPVNLEERKPKLKEMLNDYCWSVYDLVGLMLRQEDINCFYPMPTLYKLATNPRTSVHFSPEAREYIMQNKKR